MKIYRRDKLLRLAEKGKLVLVGSYHFDDILGAERSDREMPVKVRSGDPNEPHQDGVCYVRRSEFTNYGCAWENDNGTVHLHVHSNKNYDFRVLP